MTTSKDQAKMEPPLFIVGQKNNDTLRHCIQEERRRLQAERQRFEPSFLRILVEGALYDRSKGMPWVVVFFITTVQLVLLRRIMLFGGLFLHSKWSTTLLIVYALVELGMFADLMESGGGWRKNRRLAETEGASSSWWRRILVLIPMTISRTVSWVVPGAFLANVVVSELVAEFWPWSADSYGKYDIDQKLKQDDSTLLGKSLDGLLEKFGHRLKDGEPLQHARELIDHRAKLLEQEIVTTQQPQSHSRDQWNGQPVPSESKEAKGRIVATLASMRAPLAQMKKTLDGTYQRAQDTLGELRVSARLLKELFNAQEKLQALEAGVLLQEQTQRLDAGIQAEFERFRELAATYLSLFDQSWLSKMMARRTPDTHTDFQEIIKEVDAFLEKSKE